MAHSTTQFKVGDWVKPSKFNKTIPPYEVQAIHSDSYGDVLLKEPGGYGYGAHYCVKVKRPKA